LTLSDVYLHFIKEAFLQFQFQLQSECDSKTPKEQLFILSFVCSFDFSRLLSCPLLQETNSTLWTKQRRNDEKLISTFFTIENDEKLMNRVEDGVTLANSDTLFDQLIHI
jgi:hypothetical protein